jgi:hypothetical protein
VIAKHTKIVTMLPTPMTTPPMLRMLPGSHGSTISGLYPYLMFSPACRTRRTPIVAIA